MGSGILSDCWKAEERGKGMAVYQLAPVLGPAIGPIGEFPRTAEPQTRFSLKKVAGAYIAQYTTWRWSFWSIVLFNVAIQLLAFLFLEETYAPRILGLKARALRELTDDSRFQTEFEAQHRTLPTLLRVSLSRPWVMLATQPIIQTLALYQAFNYGMMYLIISSFPDLWEKSYGMPKGQAALNYISIAAGSLVGVNICGPLTDWMYKRLKAKHGIPDEEPGKPEFRVPLMIPASIITPCGILLFSWTAQKQAHLLFPNVSTITQPGGG